MTNISRRRFMKFGGALAVAVGLSPFYAEAFADGLKKISSGNVKVLWLQGQSCSGCSVSFLNSVAPDPVELLTEVISLVFHHTISAAQGDVVKQIIDKTIESKDYILLYEGSIPAKEPEACKLCGEAMTELLPRAVANAKFVVSVGTCAAYGGIPAAEGNQTGSMGVMDFLKHKGIDYKEKLVNCPSCPIHPQSLVGTLAFLASKGYPPVDERLLTPDMYYSRSTHDDCPRYHYYDQHIFATNLGDNEGCLFKLGCLGMQAYTECTRRQWNSGVNWCVRAAAPCLGCSNESFAKKRDYPFYRLGEVNEKAQEGEQG